MCNGLQLTFRGYGPQPTLTASFSVMYNHARIRREICFNQATLAISAHPGTDKMDAIANAATKRKRKLTALPVLVVLFVISYLLLTKLVIEQDKTIDSQSSMIHMLFKDNTYLSRLHKHAGALKKPKSQDSQLQTQNPASQNPASESASNQESSSQIPLAQVPSNKVGSQANAKIGRRTRKAEKAIPASPPPEPTDPSDQRRVSFSI